MFCDVTVLLYLLLYLLFMCTLPMSSQSVAQLQRADIALRIVDGVAAILHKQNTHIWYAYFATYLLDRRQTVYEKNA